MTLRFAVTFDYLCPFARNAHEHVVAGLTDGADWEVDFLPFSLSQGHAEPGEPDVWDGEGATTAPGVLALQVGIAARDHAPGRFPALHRRLFSARHDEGRDIKDPSVLREVVRAAGLDADEIFEIVDGGKPLETLRTEHRWAVDEHEVWGVPTFIAGGRAVFARLLDRPEDDAGLARHHIERVVELVTGEPWLHELKQATLPM